VAFVDEDEIEEFGRDLGVVGDGRRGFRLDQFGRVDFFGGFVEFLVLQQRVEALDGEMQTSAPLSTKLLFRRCTCRAR
jgi:hypothetical protein